jgi:chemosensory pili system protein ChpA (sensor histidine kinase/response regulator)
LAGSSATVGFKQLSGLAKLLEHALDKTSQQSHGNAEHSRLFVNAAEECRRLLHQFAAGFLVEPKANIVRELEAFKLFDTKVEVLHDVEKANIAKNETAEESIVTPIVTPIEVPAVESNKVSKIISTNVSFASIAVNEASNTLIDTQIARNKASTLNFDDDIELTDALDADLFHIFEEEAQELLPNLGKAMRLWSTNPDDLSARSEILRTLHTLKGSSRLAGAMRLGELSHRMESEIEALGTENLSPDLLEPLTVRLENLQQNFETLRHPSDNLDVEIKIAEALIADAEAAKSKLANTAVAKEQSKSEVSKSSKLMVKPPASSVLKVDKKESRQSVRVRARLLDRLVNQAGEVMLTRTRIEET